MSEQSNFTSRYHSRLDVQHTVDALEKLLQALKQSEACDPLYNDHSFEREIVTRCGVVNDKPGEYGWSLRVKKPGHDCMLSEAIDAMLQQIDWSPFAGRSWPTAELDRRPALRAQLTRTQTVFKDAPKRLAVVLEFRTPDGFSGRDN